MTVLEAVKKYDLEDFKKTYLNKREKYANFIPLDKLKNLDVLGVDIDLVNRKALIKIDTLRTE